MDPMNKTSGHSHPPPISVLTRAIQHAILLVTVCLTGCVGTGGYFEDRGRDAADIFTASAGLGGGAKARIGPLQVGLLTNIDMAGGLRGGKYGSISWYETATRETIAPYPYKMTKFPDTLYPWDYPTYIFGSDRFQVGHNRSLAARRGKTYESVSLFPFVALTKQPEYYTQIEVVIALVGSVRLGFNPGELLDFVLGWFPLDIYDDDLNRSKSSPPSALGGGHVGSGD